LITLFKSEDFSLKILNYYEKNYYLIMKKKIAQVICCIAIILVVLATGCVSPPKDNKTTSTSGSFFNPGKPDPASSATATPAYVSEVTPFLTATPDNGYRTMPTETPRPGEIFCRIYSEKFIEYNKTAIAFDLKSPPMYINYTVKPSNITKHVVYSSKITGEGEKELEIDTYSPTSWFEVTVRSKTTGEIYLKDGFGEAKGYTLYLNRTLKVLKRDNMQIEFTPNNITAVASVWVKPAGNFDNTTKFNMTTDCAYFEPNPRDIMVYATATTTATPTYILQSG
jgi:hypothetical protein